jgi:hypothetical protein
MSCKKEEVDVKKCFNTVGVLLGRNVDGITIQSLTYTPILDATTFDGIINYGAFKFKNTGSTAYAIYTFTSSTINTVSFPTAIPALTTLPGTNGLFTILAPNATSTITLRDVVLVFGIPIASVDPKIGDVILTSTASLAVDFSLKLCVDSSKDCKGCGADPVVVDSCMVAQQFIDTQGGTQRKPGVQSLFSVIGQSAKLLIAELSNTGPAPALVQGLQDGQSTSISFFPSFLASVQILANLYPQQTMIVISSNISLITATFPNLTLPLSPAATILASVTASTRILYFVVKCEDEAKESCPLSFSGFGVKRREESKSMKKEVKENKPTRLINFT